MKGERKKMNEKVFLTFQKWTFLGGLKMSIFKKPRKNLEKGILVSIF
jgi:hypothetical protein